MTLKLLTIGDSISQGFMSGAAAQTHLAYSTLAARALGLKPTHKPTGAADEYVIPVWPCNGLPLNLEAVFRRINRRVGDRIDFFDWPGVLVTAGSEIDRVEDCYEKGEGSPGRPFGAAPYFHNLAVQGFDVADAWQVTPKLCLEQIKLKESKPKPADDFLQPPSASFYRTAYNVLNPQRDPAKDDWSALTWLEHLAETQGVENLFLWLGANNALGTVISLTVRATNGPRSSFHPGMSRPERDENFNLWSPEHFRIDYEALIDRALAALAKNAHDDWKVFVGTVPAVSVAPLAKGVGDVFEMDDPFGVIQPKALYYQYYTYVIFDDEYARKGGKKLVLRDLYEIDRYIAAYNRIIRETLAKANQALGKERFFVVDICEHLLRAAWKRNKGSPTYDWPPEIRQRFPMIDTRFYYATAEGHMEAGGIFSLDGIHPTAIGQGIIAHEFLKVLRQARPGEAIGPLDWEAIYKSDALYQEPLRLMPSIRASDGAAKIFLAAASAMDRIRPVG